MNSGNRRRKGKLCFALAAIMLLLAGCAAGGASESSAAEKTDVASSPEEEQRETSGGGNTTATLSQSEGVFDLEKRTVLLNSGYEMPVIGLGTWTLSDDEAEKSVYHALKSGMRLIDTARYYGNEVGVGRGLQKAIDEEIVKREEVFITTKIYGGNYERPCRPIA